MMQEIIRPLYGDSRGLEGLATYLNSLNPEEKLILNSGSGDINLRIKSKSNDSLLYFLEKPRLELIKKEKNKEQNYFWANFQQGDIFLRGSQEREGLHLVGGNEGWTVSRESVLREENKKYSSLKLALKNFGRGAVLYIYNNFQ